jgi:hypothetical protein
VDGRKRVDYFLDKLIKGMSEEKSCEEDEPTVSSKPSHKVASILADRSVIFWS